MTLERLSSFIGAMIRRDTRHRSRGLIPARRVTFVFNATRILRVKGSIPSTPSDMWQRAWNMGLAFNKNRVLQRSRLFSKAKVAPSQQSESCVFTSKIASLQRPRFFSKLIYVSPLRVRIASLKQHDPCVYKTCIQSFASANQFNSTLTQPDDCLSLVQQHTNNQLRALRRSGLRI